MNWQNYNVSENFPLISIIIPAFNRQEIFTLSLQNALAQDYPRTEIIVVDDGSEPAVVLPVNAVEKVKLIRQENKGAPAARNRGFAESKGDFIFFWDADLMAEPNMIIKMFNALQKNSAVSYVYCDFYFGKKKMKALPFDSDKLRQVNYITTSSLIRREDFFGFDESLTKFQDWDLWLTLLEKNKTGIYVPEFLFTCEPCGTMSAWLPGFAYRAPWKWLPGIRARVKKYEQARQVIVRKHDLLP